VRRLPLSILLVAVACGRAAPAREFVLRVAGVGPFDPVHPLTSGTAVSAAAADLVYESLGRPDERGALVPFLAERWERVGPDLYRVALKRGLLFSDGSPVALEDAAASLRAAGLDARPAGEWIEVRSGAAKGALEFSLALAVVFREGPSGPLGTGPFVVAEGSSERVVLKRGRAGPGRIARVEFIAYPSERDAFAHALRGDMNAALSLDERQRELVEGIPSLKVIRSQSPHAVAIVFNAARLDRNTRALMAKSLPLADLATAYGAGCRRPEPPVPGKAVGGGRPVEVLTTAIVPGFRRVGLALRRALGLRGGGLVVLDPSHTRARLEHFDFDILVGTLLAWPPSSQAMYWHTGAGLNDASYSNGAVDAALEAGRFDEAQAELERDPPVVYLCRRERIAAVDARIKNPTLGHWGLLETLPVWEVGP
jgi:hypothetical protein